MVANHRGSSKAPAVGVGRSLVEYLDGAVLLLEPELRVSRPSADEGHHVNPGSALQEHFHGLLRAVGREGAAQPPTAGPSPRFVLLVVHLELAAGRVHLGLAHWTGAYLRPLPRFPSEFGDASVRESDAHGGGTALECEALRLPRIGNWSCGVAHLDLP